MVSSSIASSVLNASALISMMNVTSMDRTLWNGDGTVHLFQNLLPEIQLKIYAGNHFMMKATPRGANVDISDIRTLNVTQTLADSYSSMGSVSVLFTRVNGALFNVTDVWPNSTGCGGNATTLSRTHNNPYNYATYLTIKNSKDETVPYTKVASIILSPHLIVSNEGIRIDIIPNAV